MMINLLISLTISMMHLLHPFYVSFTEITHNPKNRSVEVSVRIFTSDLEQVLKTKTKEKVDLINGNEARNAQLIRDYIANNITISINNSRKTMNYVGFEEQGESIWAYFEIKNIITIGHLEVENTILYDFIEQQMNLVQAKAAGKVGMKKLNHPARRVEFHF